ncbi:MAG: tRNA lysidine(34) synthetase TilS [Candidatus Stahlbacteria bacterium]|nr:tRNA lysidine(34) synthetase TilS [Candidatus Stahlbacteria bacterium]
MQTLNPLPQRHKGTNLHKNESSKFKNQALKDILATIKKYRMLEDGDKVLVAVSGGADSIFLLRFLHTLATGPFYNLENELQIKNSEVKSQNLNTMPQRHQGTKLHQNTDVTKSFYNLELRVAHLNHCLRDGAGEDAAFVRAECDRLGIPCTISSIDVRSYCREHRLTLEEGAREVRYNFLLEVSSVYGMNKIATGHTGSDQAETFLLRVMRGCGGRGLLLIPPIRKTGDGGQKTEEKVQEFKSLRVQEFKSSRVQEFKSSRFKIEIIRPLIEIGREAAPDFCAKITRLHNILEEEEQVLDELTEDRLKTIDYRPKTKDQRSIDNGEFDLDKFLSTPLAIKRRIIRKVVGHNFFAPSFEEVENALRYIENNRGGKEFELGEVKLIKSCGKIRIVTQQEIRSKKLLLELPVPGEVELNGYKIKSKLQKLKAKIQNPNGGVEYCDFAHLTLPLFVRTAELGDRIRLKEGHKKLKALFIEAKIPVWERKGIPLVVDGGGILWVVGWRRAYRAMIGKETTKIVELSIF